MHRGQITAFIIVGILILAVVVLFFVIQRGVVEIGAEEARQIAEDVPLEFEPIQRFTQDCVAIVAERGLVRLGQQGGYVRPAEWHGLRFDAAEPTDSDGVAFAESDVRLPYWVYNSAANRANVVQLSTYKPTVETMEQELGRWMGEEISFCLDGYRSFADQFTVQQDAAEAVVSITPERVQFQVELPLTVTRDGRAAEMRHFYTEVEFGLVHLFEVASQIYDAQQQSSFLEEHTLSLMTLFSSPREDALPPMTDTTFKLANTVLWKEQDVRKSMKQLLTSYIPLLQFQGARNFFMYQFPEDAKYRETKQRVYTNMILPLTGAEDVDVRFSYLDSWEPYFDANAHGGVIQPQSVFLSAFGVPFGMQNFKTVYDISYPVWVSLYDPKAFNGRGYFFNFALEANIRNNRPVVQDQVLPAPILARRGSLLCDAEQRHSGDVMVVVRDVLENPVAGAQVTFVIGDESCGIGVTDAAGRLAAAFPVAFGGVVHVSHPDHLGLSVPVTTETGVAQSVDVVVQPLHEVSLEVKKKKLIKCGSEGCITAFYGSDPLQEPTGDGWVFQNVAVPLAPTEQAIVQLERVSARDDPFQFSTFVVGREKPLIRIPAGNYVVRMQIIADQEYVIPAKRQCEGADIIGIEVNEECYIIPEVKMEQLPLGGLFLDAEHMLSIDGAQLYGAEEMTLYAVSPALLNVPLRQRVIADLEQLGKTEEYSETYQERLTPRFS